MKNTLAQKIIAVGAAALFVALLLVIAGHAQTLQITERVSWTAPGGNSTIQLNNTFTLTSAGTNFNYVPFTVGTTGVLFQTSPQISNGWLYVINESPTNTPNYVGWGVDGTNYPNQVQCGESGLARFVPYRAGGVWFNASNGVQNGHFAWAPNP